MPSYFRLVILLAVAILNGCTPVFLYDNVKYSSSDEALAAARRDNNSLLLPVQVGSRPIQGHAMVIIPDHKRLSEKGVVKKNSPSPQEIKYIADVLHENYVALAKGLEKGNVFQKLSIMEAFDPSINQPDVDWLIWLDMQENTASWYLQMKGDGNKIAIPLNKGLERSQQVAAWVESVRLNAGNLASSIDKATAKKDSSTIISSRNEIILSQNSGVYQIPVLINDVLKIDIIFDSGASEVSMPPDVVLTLLRTGTIKDTDWLPGAYYTFADGSRAKSARFRIGSIRIGNRVIENVSCSISSSLTAPMLLGQSALKRLGKYTFDYNKGLLILE